MSDIHWRNFGRGRSDDTSSIEEGTEERAFTLEDGETSLVGWPGPKYDILVLLRKLKVHDFGKWWANHSGEEVSFVIDGKLMAKGKAYGPFEL